MSFGQAGFGSKNRQNQLRAQGQMDPFGQQVRQAMQPPAMTAYAPQTTVRSQPAVNMTAQTGGMGQTAPTTAQTGGTLPTKPVTPGTAQPIQPQSQGTQYAPPSPEEAARQRQKEQDTRDWLDEQRRANMSPEQYAEQQARIRKVSGPQSPIPQVASLGAGMYDQVMQQRYIDARDQRAADLKSQQDYLAAWKGVQPFDQWLAARNAGPAASAPTQTSAATPATVAQPATTMTTPPVGSGPMMPSGKGADDPRSQRPSDPTAPPGGTAQTAPTGGGLYVGPDGKLTPTRPSDPTAPLINPGPRPTSPGTAQPIQPQSQGDPYGDWGASMQGAWQQAAQDQELKRIGRDQLGMKPPTLSPGDMSISDWQTQRSGMDAAYLQQVRDEMAKRGMQAPQTQLPVGMVIDQNGNWSPDWARLQQEQDDEMRRWLGGNHNAANPWS